jgi:acylphosphatase
MIHIIISGDVQGVGFRQYVKYQAKKLNIKGWVKNLPNGRVEGLFVGDRENTEKIIEYCRRGPFLAQVKNVEIEEKEDIIFNSFEIIKG